MDSKYTFLDGSVSRGALKLQAEHTMNQLLCNQFEANEWSVDRLRSGGDRLPFLGDQFR